MYIKKNVQPLQREINFRLTSKDDPYTVRIKIFLMAVDPWDRYSNESERAN